MKKYLPLLAVAGHGFLANTVSKNLFQQSYVVKRLLNSWSIFHFTLEHLA